MSERNHAALLQTGVGASQQFQNFTLRNSIKHRFCPPEKHQINGFVERIIKTLKTNSFALMNHASLSAMLFPFAFLYSTYVYNLTWHSVLKDKPCSIFYGHKTSESRLKTIRTFGATAFFKEGTGIYLEMFHFRRRLP